MHQDINFFFVGWLKIKFSVSTGGLGIHTYEIVIDAEIYKIFLF